MSVKTLSFTERALEEAIDLLNVGKAAEASIYLASALHRAQVKPESVDTERFKFLIRSVMAAAEDLS